MTESPKESGAYDFDEIVDRHNTNCEKTDAAFDFNPDLPDDFISLWVADMEFACPQPIIDAMMRRLERGVLGYTVDHDRSYSLAVKNWMKRRFDWEPDMSTMVTTTGICRALFNSVITLTKEQKEIPKSSTNSNSINTSNSSETNETIKTSEKSAKNEKSEMKEVINEAIDDGRDGVIIMTPSYRPFNSAIDAFNRRKVYTHLLCDENTHYFTIDFSDLEKKCRVPSNKLLFLCNPHNPTGRVWTECELRRIGEICFANDVFVVSDEVHADLIRIKDEKGNFVKHTPFAKLFPNEKRIITCTAPSKTFNLASIQLSNIFINDPAIKKDWEMKRFTQQPNCLSVEATKAAYNECEQWLEQLKTYLDGNFQLLKDRLNKEIPEIGLSISEGTYLQWIDFSKLGLSEDEVKRRINRAGVYIQFGNKDFVANAENHARINVSCPRKMLDEAIDKIVMCLKGNYIAPQFVGQLEKGAKFIDLPDEFKFLKDYYGEKKTVIYFLRYFGCPLTQYELLELKDKRIKDNENIKLIVVLNSSKENFEKSSINKIEEFPFEIIFDPLGKIFKALSIRDAKSEEYLIDSKTNFKINLCEDRKIMKLEREEKSSELQRPATFVIAHNKTQPEEDLVEFVRYGHGAGDVPPFEDVCEII